MLQKAKYFDGRSAKAHGVSVTLGARGLIILDDEHHHLLAEWNYDDLHLIRRDKEGVVLAQNIDGDAQLVVEGVALYEALRQPAPHLHRRFLPTKASQREFIWVSVIVVALLVIGVVAIPAGLEFGLRQLPRETQAGFGAPVRKMLMGKKGACENPAADKIIARLADRLAAHLDEAPQLIIQVADNKMPNAFATPGGYVVIMRGLLERMKSGDEFAAVLAHEIGHVHKDHPMVMLSRALGITLLLDILIGDSTVISTVLAEAGGMAILFSYSRDFERQADDLAFQMMRGAGIDANAMGRLFGRLQKELKGKKADSKFSQAMDLLSSHPGFDERIAKAELAAAGYRYHPALSAQEWRLVQNYCGD